MFSFAILGGILLNIGAYLTYKGNIYQAVIVYMFADLCWIIMAYEKQDFVGAGFIIVGTIFGFLAYLKMKDGEMNKSLNEDDA
ncbi:MAG: hypothetical protein FAF04_08060 [Epsilonproteobacteria bacterium]|nr:hypothetical protein [Campylobacterota bacterium]